MPEEVPLLVASLYEPSMPDDFPGGRVVTANICGCRVYLTAKGVAHLEATGDSVICHPHMEELARAAGPGTVAPPKYLEGTEEQLKRAFGRQMGARLFRENQAHIEATMAPYVVQQDPMGHEPNLPKEEKQ